MQAFSLLKIYLNACNIEYTLLYFIRNIKATIAVKLMSV